MFLHWNDFNLKENKKRTRHHVLGCHGQQSGFLRFRFLIWLFYQCPDLYILVHKFYYACQCLFCFTQLQIVLHVIAMVIPSDIALFSGLFLELHLMFSLMDKVPSGIEPMLKDLEEHIVSAGLADMVAAAETITTVGILLCTIQDGQI